VSRGAVFLDRDGTVIVDVGFPRSPDEVQLIPGAATAIRRLNEAGWLVIVVTNQSGIARGLLTYEDYDAVRERMEALLAAEGGGARVDASYMCPHHPDFTGACECRKPGTLLFRRAVEEHGLDASASWFIGDRMRDVSPARAFGGTGILVPSRGTVDQDIAAARREFSVANSLDEAVTRIIESRP
jgi:histidinol-phosphate phosphatase family protein